MLGELKTPEDGEKGRRCRNQPEEEPLPPQGYRDKARGSVGRAQNQARFSQNLLAELPEKYGL